jgi:hypothetical protein
MEVFYSTLTAVAESLKKKNGNTTLEVDYKSADLSNFTPELSPDGAVDLVITKEVAGKVQFVTPELEEGLVKMSVYEELHAIVLLGYNELTQGFKKCIGIVGYDDARGFVILDGQEGRAFKVANLHIEAKKHLQLYNPDYKFIIFEEPAPVVVKVEEPSTPKKKVKVVTKKKTVTAVTATPTTTTVSTN